MGDRSPKDKQKKKKQHEVAHIEEQRRKKENWDKNHPKQDKSNGDNPYKKAG